MRAFHCHELSPTFKNKRCLFSSFEILTGRLVANPTRLGKAQNLEFGTHLTSTCFFQSLIYTGSSGNLYAYGEQTMVFKK